MNTLKKNFSIIICLLFFFVFNPYNMAYMDAPHPWQVGFQDPATPIMEGIISFNGLLMTFMLLIACFVGWLLYKSLIVFNESANAEPASFNHSTLLEVVWTIVPAGILMIISVPSYNLLYAMEEVIDPSLTIKVVGHQWYWSYECSDFEVAPRVTQNNLELIERNVKNLKDWAELVECDRVKSSQKGSAGSFDKFDVGIKKSSEKFYAMNSELGNLIDECGQAEKELYDARLDLNSAESDFEQARINLVAAKANRANAEAIKARVELSGNNSSFRRGHLLLDKGYKGWDDNLRIKTKEVSEVVNEGLIKAEQEFRSASAILDITSTGLDTEELIRIKTIAKSSESEFMEYDNKIFPVFLRLDKAMKILREADCNLNTFSSIFEIAEKKLEKSRVIFNEAKSCFRNKYVEFRGSTAFFESSDSSFNNPVVLKLSLEDSDIKFDKATDGFNRAQKWLKGAEEELVKVTKKIRIAESHANEIKISLREALLIEKEDAESKAPIFYFDNFLWERFNGDLLGYETQLRCGKLELEAAKEELENAQFNFRNKVESLIDADIERAKVKVSLSESGYDELVPLSEASLNNDRKSLVKLKMRILEALNKEIANNHEVESINKLYSVIKLKVLSDLSDLLLQSKAFGLNQANTDCSTDCGLDPLYSEVWLKKIQDESTRAETNYTDVSNKLTESLFLLAAHEDNLLESRNILDSKSWNTHWLSYKSVVDDVNSNIEYYRNPIYDVELFDIKLNPSIISSKVYTALLQAEARLNNIRQISEILFRDIEKRLNNNSNLVPNAIFYSNSKDSSDSSINNSDVGSVNNSSDDKKSGSENLIDGLDKSYSDIREILSSLEDKDISPVQTDLFVEILQTFRELVEILNDTDLDSIRNLLYKLLPSIGEEESSKNQKLKDQINMILDLIDGSSDENENMERRRINFDSYLIADDDLIIPDTHSTGKAGKVFRLLEVDNRLFVPINTHIRVLVTSADVLHSWAVPSLGVKVDACPGRLNQVFLFVKREGVFYGQCSELCGVNHGFMPIVVQAVNTEDYLTWVGKRLCS